MNSINNILYQRSMECPSHHLKLQLIEESNHGGKCEMCFRPSTLQCTSCKFSLCQLCRICNKKHFLVKLIQLSKLNAGYYNNDYSCNICKASKTGDDDGLWHCNECNYDVCPECSQ